MCLSYSLLLCVAFVAFLLLTTIPISPVFNPNKIINKTRAFLCVSFIFHFSFDLSERYRLCKSKFFKKFNRILRNLTFDIKNRLQMLNGAQSKKLSLQYYIFVFGMCPLVSFWLSRSFGLMMLSVVVTSFAAYSLTRPRPSWNLIFTSKAFSCIFLHYFSATVRCWIFSVNLFFTRFILKASNFYIFFFLSFHLSFGSLTRCLSTSQIISKIPSWAFQSVVSIFA